MDEKDKNSNLEKSIQLAIQAQKDIQKQLLAEIAQLKEQPDHSTPKAKTFQFYNYQLQKLSSDVETINSEIHKSETIVIPDLECTLDSLLKKRSRIEHRINEIQKERDPIFLDSFDNETDTSNFSAKITELINKITLDIQTLTAKKEENSKQIKELRTHLEELQRNQYNGRREVAMQFWADEVATEKKFNIANLTRRQSMFDSKRPPMRVPLPNVLMSRRYSAQDKKAQFGANQNVY